jgi:hypothetical protein
MSETIWTTASEPPRLLSLLGEEASPRKLRLFACACCRQLGSRLSDEARTHVDHCERFADGEATFRALQGSDVVLGRRQTETQQALLHQVPSMLEMERESILAALRCLSGRSAYQVAINTAYAVRSIGGRVTAFGGRVTASGSFTPDLDGERNARNDQAKLLRDIFGNPFRPIPIGPAPNDPIRRLAQLIYDERRVDHLPILADALEEAGCTSESVLGHCRSAGPHVRGCWVVDALLGKC